MDDPKEEVAAPRPIPPGKNPNNLNPSLCGSPRARNPWRSLPPQLLYPLRASHSLKSPPTPPPILTRDATTPLNSKKDLRLLKSKDINKTLIEEAVAAEELTEVAGNVVVVP